MILFSFFWFIWEITPETALRAILIRIIIFIKNNRINDGASFCQVIRMEPFITGILFIISMNHLWKGLAASLIRTAIVPPIIRAVLGVCCVFIIINITRMAEATDWMIKYFRLLSRFFFMYDFLIKNNEQKANVFISNPTQIANHEFLVTTHRVDLVKNTTNIGE